MPFLADLFSTEHPIIGLLHLKALPGDPFYDDQTGLPTVVEAATRDLEALQEGGIDGILITNEFSVPYQQHVSPVILAAMAYVIGALRPMIQVPFGAETIYDELASIELCAATGAQFSRCVFSDVWVDNLGLVYRDIATTLRRRRELRCDDLRLFYFITSEGETNLGGRMPAELIDSLSFNCRSDAYVVGGSAAGVSPSIDDLAALSHAVSPTPLLASTGCRPDAIASILEAAQGAFVETALKHEGKIENPVDVERVKTFMQAARAGRGEN